MIEYVLTSKGILCREFIFAVLISDSRSRGTHKIFSRDLLGPACATSRPQTNRDSSQSASSKCPLTKPSCPGLSALLSYVVEQIASMKGREDEGLLAVS